MLRFDVETTRFSKIMMIMMLIGLFRKILFSFHNNFKWKKKTLILFTGRHYPHPCLRLFWGLTKQPTGRGVCPQDLSPGETLRRPLPMFTSPFQIHSERISPHYESEWDYYSLYNHVTNSDQFVRWHMWKTLTWYRFWSSIWQAARQSHLLKRCFWQCSHSGKLDVGHKALFTQNHV